MSREEAEEDRGGREEDPRPEQAGLAKRSAAPFAEGRAAEEERATAEGRGRSPRAAPAKRSAARQLPAHTGETDALQLLSD
jgi:hypothetical protein